MFDLIRLVSTWKVCVRLGLTGFVLEWFGVGVVGRVFIDGIDGVGGLGAVCEVRVPRDLLGEVGGEGEAGRLLRVGLLSLRVASLQREIADICKGVEVQRRRVAELPLEVERFRRLLARALDDRKTLEKLLEQKR